MYAINAVSKKWWIDKFLNDHDPLGPFVRCAYYSQCMPKNPNLTKHALALAYLQLMAISPEHSIWLRERQAHHAGAIRHYESYLDSDDGNDSYPRGPGTSPVHCELCAQSGSFAYCSPSSHSTMSPSCHLYLSSCTDTSIDSLDEQPASCRPYYSPSRFDMQGKFYLKVTNEVEVS